MATREILSLDESTPQILAPQTGDTYLAPRTINITPEVNTSGLVVTGGTATASAPVLDLTQTWNNAAVTFTGLKFNVPTDSSAAGSLLMDLQVAGASKLSVTKGGSLTANNMTIGGGNGTNGQITYTNTQQYQFLTSNNPRAAIGNGYFQVNSGGSFQWSSATIPNITPDLIIARDDPNTLAQRNGANAQTFRIYNTFTDASNYERGKLQWDSNVLKIGTEKAGTGTARALELQTDGTRRLNVATDGCVTVGGTALSLPFANYGSVLLAGSSGGFLGFYDSTTTRYASIYATSTKLQLENNVIVLANTAGSDAARVTFGGTTSSFPALKRSGAGLISRLADDSADAAFTASTLTASSSAANTSAIASTGYSLTGSSAVSMVDLAGTWNTTGTPTAIKLNVTDTASNAASLLMDLGTGGGSFSSRFSVDKTGQVKIGDGTNTLTIDSSNGAITFLQVPQITLQTSNALVLRHGNNDAVNIRAVSGAVDPKLDFLNTSNTIQVRLTTETAGILAQQDAANAQTFRIYNTYTDASNYERGKLQWDSNVLKIGTEVAGTGTARAVQLVAGTYSVIGNDAAGTTTIYGGLGGKLSITSGGTTLGGNLTTGDYNIILGTTTGTKIGTATSQKLGFWNATPIVQPTTGIAEATFVENSGGTAVNVDSTFDGYTLQQIAKALRDAGLLA